MTRAVVVAMPRRLLAIGRDEGLWRITADILPENVGMQRVAERFGFRLHHDFAEEVVRAAIDLRG